MPGGLSAQDVQFKYLQGTATTTASVNGNGASASIQGYNGAIQVEVVESNGGTATLNLQGSFDGTNWYNVGYYTIDGQATLSRSASAISVAANSKHVYQVLDPYPKLRGVLSSVASTPHILVRAYCMPV